MDEKIWAEIDKLAGNIIATQAAIRGLILAQPDPLATAAAVKRELERLISTALPAAVPEAYLEGLREGKSSVIPTPEDWRGLGLDVPSARP